ncbi:phosphatidylinositol-3-phosphatase [Anaerolineales bacterium]|nr:phosphatidylinositol-3-phosphatase [Anaerolineales bacterium]
MTLTVRLLWVTLLISLLITSCQPAPTEVPSTLPVTLAPFPTSTPAPAESMPTAESTPVPLPLVPNFSHIVMIVFENKEFGSVIGNGKMAYFNLLANSYTLLTSHYAVTHPSLPNYLSFIGGDTFGITDDCEDCFVNAPSLPDFIEQSGRTWKTYQDDMPDPCFVGSTLRYAQKHNPFIYFDPIRLNTERCQRSVVPLTQLDGDIALNDLPNFMFITPDICYSSHDCGLDLADSWLKDLLDKLYPVLESTDEPFLIILTWDEGQGDHSCCGLSESAGGRVATILISPQVKQNFMDETPYSHYSILKTIAEAWGLPKLGHAADAETNLIAAPWK